MAGNKTNSFSFALNEFGQISHAVVDIVSPRYGLKQMLIDMDDLHLLEDCSVFATFCKKSKVFYIRKSLNKRSVGLHRLIMNATATDIIDHISGDTLDNRKQNLRIVCAKGNSRNKKRHRAGSLLGAYYNTSRKVWQSYIFIGYGKDRKHVYIGAFDTEQEAHEAFLAYEAVHDRS